MNNFMAGFQRGFFLFNNTFGEFLGMLFGAIATLMIITFFIAIVLCIIESVFN